MWIHIWDAVLGLVAGGIIVFAVEATGIFEDKLYFLSDRGMPLFVVRVTQKILAWSFRIIAAVLVYLLGEPYLNEGTSTSRFVVLIAGFFAGMFIVDRLLHLFQHDTA
jgi:hypothetical protein